MGEKHNKEKMKLSNTLDSLCETNLILAQHSVTVAYLSETS